MAQVTVRTLDRSSLGDWEHFVQQHPNATFFHRPGWKRVIEESFGARCYFLQAWCSGQTTGVLPLVHMRSRLFGDALVSSAYGVYGGSIALDQQSITALDTAAEELGKKLDVDYVEYRYRTPSGQSREMKSSLYATFRKVIGGPDNLSFVPRKRRASVRKAQSLGLKSTITQNVDTFYSLYARNKRDLGTPVYSRAYFVKLAEVFGNDCDIFIVNNNNDDAVCSVMVFYFRDEVLPYYSGANRKARDCAANDFMYWRLMKRAVEEGYRWFDFGRSKTGTGSFKYKQLWGFDPHFLNYEYVLFNRSKMPDLSPLNPKYAWLTSLWKQLPLPIANRLGPLISGGLG
jgi:FemAB-related protein (PEP-CTERM system-associated)